MPARKLSDNDVAEMLTMHAGGATLNDLAAAFDVSPQHVGRLVRSNAAKDGQPPPVTPLTVEEVEEALAKAVRRGSIGAIKLWFDRHASDDPARDDPFAEFDAEGDPR
jgi:hypothetical protein